jgi:hypothetical protein
MVNKKIYITLVIVGAVGAVAGILMTRSADPSLHSPGKILGWGGIALLLITRIFFARRRPVPAPPAKK